MLSREMVKEPQMWQLVMEVSASSLSVMAFSPYEDHTLISGNILFEEAGPSQLRKLEDAVYDNPLVLCDFKSVTVLWDTSRFLLLPGFVEDRVLAEQAFRTVFPEDTSDCPSELVFNRLPGLDAMLVMEMPADIAGFFRRTFNNPVIMHPLEPLARYVKGKYSSHGNGNGKMFVNVCDGRCDVVVLGFEAPLLVNSFRYRAPMDAVYYIMACREALGLRASDEILIAGSNADRTAVTPILRRFVPYVMPAIFPSTMFRAGRSALSTPFEIIVTPLVGDGMERKK